MATLALGWLGSCAIDWWCIARPPRLDARPAILNEPFHDSSGVRRLGRSWLARKDGILRMHLAGGPFTLGYCNALLTKDLVVEQEATLLRTVKEHVPSSSALWLMKKYVLLRNRNLPSYVSLPHQLEILGLASAYPDPHPGLGPYYHRLLNYHAAHDISHALMDSPLVGGCTSFAAWGAATQNGHLLVGRNFDFDAGRCFDENKVVVRFEPDDGLDFISVAWPGLIGVVTGINDARIAVAINAAQSADSRQIGTPVSLVLRNVLQHASTLDDAVRIIRESQVFIADSYLVADGKTNQAVVVEKTPLRCAVRTPAANHIVCSNHFLTDELRGDAANARYMAEGTTVARQERVEALVAGRAPLAPADVAAILRDGWVPASEIGNPKSRMAPSATSPPSTPSPPPTPSSCTSRPGSSGSRPFSINWALTCRLA